MLKKKHRPLSMKINRGHLLVMCILLMKLDNYWTKGSLVIYGTTIAVCKLENPVTFN